MKQHKIYQLTSIGRPLDPGYASNKAVLILMPTAGLIAGVIAALQGQFITGIVIQSLASLLVVIASWALARELSPDDNPAAFISLVLAFLAFLSNAASGLPLLIVALFLVRIVNRSTGLRARFSDSVIVLLVCLWAMISLGMPGLGVIAALTFLLDALLSDPLRRHIVFAVMCLAAVLVYLSQYAVGIDYYWAGFSVWYWLPSVISGLFLIIILVTRKIESVADIGGTPLAVTRVRSGMGIGLLLTVMSIMTGPEVMGSAGLLLATLAGIVLGSVLRGLRPALNSMLR